MPNEILLNGCAPEPLIHYLKALGVFRLVAEQCDPQVRGAWRGDVFVLETERNRDDLLAFFFESYQPTPIVAPWNGGSGFYEGEDISAREALRHSASERLKAYRNVINQVLTFPELPATSHLTLADLINRIEELCAGATDKESEKARELLGDVKRLLSGISNSQQIQGATIGEIENFRGSVSKGDNEIHLINGLLKLARKLRTIVKKSERAAGKDEIVRACRNRLSDGTAHWVDAALALVESYAESPLLGAGGIDGRTEFSKNFMVCLRQTLPELIRAVSVGREVEKQVEQSKSQLRAALLGEPGALAESTVGMFFPQGVGGAANASQGPKIDSDESMVNPWDLILAIEGTLLLASATVRQLAAGARSRASFPFTAENSAVGYGTAVSGEKMRAEIWLPLWSRSASFAEVAHIFGEGRVRFSGTQKRVVRSGFDFARAVAELGVDRGIDAFQRYGFIERNGQANLAAPLGRFEVRERPRAALIHQVDRWLSDFHKAIMAKDIQPRFVRAFAQVEDAIFNLCASGEREHLAATLIALGRAEAEWASSPKPRKKHSIRPLAGLTERWASECDDRSHEFEIAAALASLSGEGKRALFRAHLEPVEVADGKLGWTNDETGVVWSAGELADNLAAVLHRRSIDARAAGAAHPALLSARQASLASVDAFLRGETDDEQLEALLRGLALINWRGNTAQVPRQSEIVPPMLPRAYALLKLLFLPEGRFAPRSDEEALIIRHEPSVVPLLCAGRVAEALEVAERRLRSSGLVPLTSQFHFPPENGPRLAAALLIPIRPYAIEALASLVLRPAEPDDCIGLPNEIH